MPRKRKRPIEVLSNDEIERLLRAASSRAPSGLRARAMIGLMYYAGLRLSEVLNLIERDIDLAEGVINIRNGKGGQQRLAGLNSAAEAHLRLWLETRRKLGISSRRPIFTSYSKVDGERQVKPLKPRYVQLLVKRLAKRAGIEKPVWPHLLRHSHAVHLLRRGVSIPIIQRQLGHKNLATTSVYLEGLGIGEHVTAVRDLEW